MRFTAVSPICFPVGARSRLPADVGPFCSPEDRFGFVQQLTAELTQGMISRIGPGCIPDRLPRWARNSTIRAGYPARRRAERGPSRSGPDQIARAREEGPQEDQD
jgi:hypothetical protein